MADKIIGSLIYGHHEVPKKARALKERLKVPVAIGLALLIIGVLAYKFANYREERQVARFVEAVQRGDYDAAYALWDGSSGRYRMEDFLVDWGKNGYYTTDMTTADVVDSTSQGQSVIVYVGANNLKIPVAIRVEKETLKLSFSPINKYDLAAP